MQFRSIKGFTGWGQFGILLVFIGLGIVLAVPVQEYIGMKVLGLHRFPGESDVAGLEDALLKPANVAYAQLLQILVTFLFFFVPSILFIIICYNKLLWAGFSKYFTLNQIGIAFLLVLVANYFANPFEEMSKACFVHFPYWDKLAKDAEALYNKEIASMSTLNTLPQLLVGIFIIAFLPALFEEFFFRGVLQNLFVRWWKKPILAITVTSILFSLIHASYYLFISRFILGFVLGLLFYQSKNIWVNIIAHFINNFLALLALFAVNMSKAAAPAADALDKKLPYWTLLITGSILFLLFNQFKKTSTEKRQQIEAEESFELAKSNIPFVNDINNIGTN